MNNVSMYSINGSTGALTAIGAGTIAAGTRALLNSRGTYGPVRLRGQPKLERLDVCHQLNHRRLDANRGWDHSRRVDP